MTEPQVETAPVETAEFKETNIGAEIHAQTQAPSEQGKAETFNPEIHCSNTDGTPKRNSDGTFRKKPLKKNAPKEVQGEIENNFETPAPISTVQMIEMALSVGTMMAVSQLGEEWKPTDDERKMIVDIYARYMHYKGWDLEASPEMILIGVTLGYLMPRIMTPKFMARFKKVEQNAYTGDRADGNGQIDPSKNNSKPVNFGGAGSDRIRPPV